jgi:bacteriocin biosynthesis cyclodehydratase domain-containing protein
MSRLRLSPSASLTLTTVGVLLRSDLGTFQLSGSDVKIFVDQIVSFLDGTRNKEEIINGLSEYSRDSVINFLEVLEQAGMLETTPDQPAVNERWQGQYEFFRKWTAHPGEAMNKVKMARVLMVGLEPWGVIAATELAAAGLGAIHLLDDGFITSDDLTLVRLWDQGYIGKARREALQEKLSAIAPWCRVTTDSLSLNADRSIALDDGPLDLIMTAVPGDDLIVLKAVAEHAHQAGVISLYGHLEGIDATVGPAVFPGKTACWNCTRLRLLANSGIPEAAHALQDSLLSARPQPRTHMYLGPMPGLLGHLLSAEALKLLSGYTNSRLFGRFLIQNLVELEASYHAVIRMPWCEVCGTPGNNLCHPGGTVFNEPLLDQHEKKN